MEPLVLILPRVWKSNYVRMRQTTRHHYKNDFLCLMNMHYALTHHSKPNYMCHIGPSEDTESSTMSSPIIDHSPSQHFILHDSFQGQNDLKNFVDLCTAALHLRQRMKEECLIHSSYSAYFNDENNNNHSNSLFHNCFHSYETLRWLIDKQLCKTMEDGQAIFRALVKLKIIHHVCDLNDFEYPTSNSAQHSVKYLYRFRLDDGTADQNVSFEHVASIYESYNSLFTLEKSQCRGVDLQQKPSTTNRYDEQAGIALKGDNLARMLALRSCSNMSNVERLADEMINYGFIRFDLCEQGNECRCERRFRNDEHHQYLLCLSYRLLPNQRLDLIALMQDGLNEHSSSLNNSPKSREKLRTSSSNSSIATNGTHRTNSNSDDIDCTLKISCSIDGIRRKKSASLNSPGNSENRPTAEELERREWPWCWRSYSLKRTRRGYGIILQGPGPCYVERLDPYGSAYTSGIRVNEYIYAIEGINVLRRSGKEVERLLSMFDKCTIYTIYNRDEFCPITSSPIEIHEKKDLNGWKQYSSSLNEYGSERKSLLTTVIYPPMNSVHPPAIVSYSSSPSSSVEGSSSCSVSPKQIPADPPTKKGPLSKHLPFFRLTSRSCSNALK